MAEGNNIINLPKIKQQVSYAIKNFFANIHTDEPQELYKKIDERKSVLLVLINNPEIKNNSKTKAETAQNFVDKEIEKEIKNIFEKLDSAEGKDKIKDTLTFPYFDQVDTVLKNMHKKYLERMLKKCGKEWDSSQHLQLNYITYILENQNTIYDSAYKNKKDFSIFSSIISAKNNVLNNPSEMMRLDKLLKHEKNLYGIKDDTVTKNELKSKLLEILKDPKGHKYLRNDEELYAKLKDHELIDDKMQMKIDEQRNYGKFSKFQKRIMTIMGKIFKSFTKLHGRIQDSLGLYYGKQNANKKNNLMNLFKKRKENLQQALDRKLDYNNNDKKIQFDKLMQMIEKNGKSDLKNKFGCLKKHTSETHVKRLTDRGDKTKLTSKNSFVR